MLPLLCVCIAASGPIRFELPVKHAKPSRLVEMMRGDGERPPLMPNDVTLDADDAKGKIIVVGSAEEAMEARRFVRLMDREPRRVRMVVTIDSAADHVHKTMTTEVADAFAWQFADEESSVRLALKPRVTDHGEVQSSVHLEYRGGSMETTARVKLGRSFRITPGKQPVFAVFAENDPAGKTKVKVEDRSVAAPTIEIAFQELPKAPRR